MGAPHPTALHWRMRLRKFCEGTKFETSVTVMILANAAFLGARTEHLAQHPGEVTPEYFNTIDRIFTVIMALELGLRIVAYGRFFWWGTDWAWSYFDATVVGFAVADAVADFITGAGTTTSTTTLRSLRLLRVARLVRALRIVRLMSFMRALRDLVFSIIATLQSLAWSMVFFSMFIYTFAILFTEACVDWNVLQCESDVITCGYDSSEGVPQVLLSHWGTVPKSMLTLYKVATSGMDWGEAVDPLMTLGGAWFALFIFYITFSFFAVINIVTALFCQSAVEFGQNDPDSVIFNNVQAKKRLIGRLTQFFIFLSKGFDTISRADFIQSHHDQCVRAYFEGLEIHCDDSDELFDLIDKDDDGHLSREEFVDGCLALRGGARCLELASLASQADMLQVHVGMLADRLDATLEYLYGSESLAEWDDELHAAETTVALPCLHD
eukprot:NODE_380_length_1617_cov_339.211268.p1 GENE.NODE_380_length_1617_cov_339.211268~~NODE_380_length_1617_cov_339.211268.p1  ORF type:complete len:439 (+),score=150.86 NODE_380_length_1617_cov_339.211268:3-1319(+)